MSTGHVKDRRGYTAVVQNLTRQALAVAFDTAPHRPPAGELRWAMAQALCAARVLTDAASDEDRAAIAKESSLLEQTLAEPTGKVTDGFGHSRPVYAWLGLQLLTIAAEKQQDDVALDRLRCAADLRLQVEDTDPRLEVWRAVVANRLGLTEIRPVLADQVITEPEPLVSLGRDDLIDAWTYRELVGLHGLYRYAMASGDKAAHARVRSAAEYHLGHTQPDYTTYQPWGLAAFAADVMTAVFAEQQLHDVATHLSIEGPGGAVLPALLLADAWAAMA